MEALTGWTSVLGSATSTRGVEIVKRGFTLIELLVVIAIIALLIGILLPVLGSARQEGRKVVELAALRSLMYAYHSYADDHDGFVMRSGYGFRDPGLGEVLLRDDAGTEITNPLVKQRYPYFIAPYIDFTWAGATHVNARASVVRDFREFVQDNAYDDWVYEVSVFPSFGYNSIHVGGSTSTTTALREAVFDRGRYTRRISDVLAPSELLAFASSRGRFGNGPVEDGFHVVRPPELEIADWDQAVEPADIGYLHPRYADSATVGFIDGHAGTAQWDALQDRRLWSDYARRKNLPDWDPTESAR